MEVGEGGREGGRKEGRKGEGAEGKMEVGEGTEREGRGERAFSTGSNIHNLTRGKIYRTLKVIRTHHH